MARDHGGGTARRLTMFWVAMALVVAGSGLLAGRDPVTPLTAGTTEMTLFARRPNAGIVSLWLRWDAPAGSAGWAVVEAARAWSTSDAMSWRRRIHPGWNYLVWPDVWTLPADEPVRLRLAEGAGAAWRVAAARADATYGLHHLTQLRGLLTALALAALIAAARTVVAASQPAAPSAWRWWLAVGAVAGLAVWLRAHTLSLQSLWFDEVLTAIGAQNLAWITYTPQIFGHPPLQYLAAWAVGGSAAHEAGLRLPSVAAGVATVLALAWLGRRLFGPTTGLMAGLGLSLSTLHVEVSQLGRPYALFLLLTVLSMCALIRALNRGRALDWLWFSALLALNLYTHYLALQVLVLEAVTVAVFLARRRWRGALCAAVSFGGALVLLLPWLPVLRRLGSTQLGQGELPALVLQELVTRVFVPQFLGPGLGTVTGLGLIACALWSLRRQPHLVLTMLAWAGLPLVMLWLAQPAHFVAGRHLAFVLPILMLLLGHGFATVAQGTARTVRSLGTTRRSYQRLGAALAAALVAIAWGTPAAEALRAYYQGRTGADWRTVANMLDRLIPETDRVVATVVAVYPLRHYWSLRVEEITAVGFPETPSGDGRRAWIVAHEGRGRPPELTEWLGAHAVKVGEMPASWSLPPLEIYRLRAQPRASLAWLVPGGRPDGAPAAATARDGGASLKGCHLKIADFLDGSPGSTVQEPGECRRRRRPVPDEQAFVLTVVVENVDDERVGPHAHASEGPALAKRR